MLRFHQLHNKHILFKQDRNDIKKVIFKFLPINQFFTKHVISCLWHQKERSWFGKQQHYEPEFTGHNGIFTKCKLKNIQEPISATRLSHFHFIIAIFISNPCFLILLSFNWSIESIYGSMKYELTCIQNAVDLTACTGKKKRGGMRISATFAKTVLRLRNQAGRW